MNRAAENAPAFIEAFWDCLGDLKQSGYAVPDVRFINAILAEHEAGYEIQPPALVRHVSTASYAKLPYFLAGRARLPEQRGVESTVGCWNLIPQPRR